MTTTVCSTTPNRKEKIQALMAQMNNGLLERQHQVKLMLLAALSGEHLLLVGPPGTAKSELAKRLKEVFVEANYFERLVTRFSVPEELFGPLSIKALEEDRYNRLTSGYLPEASVAFIDEIFKANSAILNSLLTLLNERQFDNGNRRVLVPLISVVAASNELPDGEELNALYDRFILRCDVAPVSDEAFENLLDSELTRYDPNLSVRLKVEELQEVQRLADKVELTAAVKEVCKEFRNYLKAQEIYVSDRRWRKLVKLMKVSAFTSGFEQTTVYDAWVLPHGLWEKPEQFAELHELYIRLITVNAQKPPKTVSQMLYAWEQTLKKERKESVQKYNEEGKPLYIDENGQKTTKTHRKVQKTNSNGEKLYRDDSDNSETTSETSRYNYARVVNNDPIIIEKLNKSATEPRKYSDSHITGRTEEVGDIIHAIREHYDHISLESEKVESLFQAHLWLDSTLLPKVVTALSQSKKNAERLLERALKLQKGFENLPKEESLFTTDIDASPAEVVALEGELCD